jgi:monofunctional biosynthetic peptidoglycan transglycosylase
VIARAKAALRRGLRVLGFLVACAVVVPALQVLVVRWVNPPFTLTMVQRVLERGVAGDGWAWVDRRWVPLEGMGREVPRAAVASEDGRFYVHHGFDYEGICAALQSNRSGGHLRGGSTISQQVARNVFLVQHRGWLRKGLEAYYTVWLELLVPKDRILELYLNVAETGPHHFGFEASAQHFYGRSVDGLSPSQAARLVALLPSPRRRSPQGEAADKKVGWIARNPVPFPGDPGFDQLQRGWAETPWPWECL